MQPLQRELRQWAMSRALPSIVQTENLSRRSVSVLIVGSVAAGNCRPGSDVDMAILCRRRLFARMGRNKPWAAGRPTEVRLDGRQLHCYAETVTSVRRRLLDLDDRVHYIYGTALPLLDRPRFYSEDIAPLANSEALRGTRLEGKLDMLRRRLGAIRGSMADAEPLVLSKMSLEVICLALKVSALLDGVAFDPRKRLMETALRGPLGRRLKRTVVGALNCASAWTPASGNPEFLRCMSRLQRRLESSAREGGYAVGLAKPDHRAQE
jgi:predicted nucleotidyltransferase